MLMMRRTGAWAVALLPLWVGCQSEADARRALEGDGYSDIVLEKKGDRYDFRAQKGEQSCHGTIRVKASGGSTSIDKTVVCSAPIAEQPSSTTSPVTEASAPIASARRPPPERVPPPPAVMSKLLGEIGNRASLRRSHIKEPPIDTIIELPAGFAEQKTDTVNAVEYALLEGEGAAARPSKWCTISIYVMRWEDLAESKYIRNQLSEKTTDEASDMRVLVSGRGPRLLTTYLAMKLEGRGIACEIRVLGDVSNADAAPITKWMEKACGTLKPTMVPH